MKIAVEGCCHGELDNIYETLAFLEKKNNIKVDLLLICGDFQSVRNKADLECMAVPPKHRQMNTFYKYYSGEKVAPVLTVFIGGNHEASNYLQELPYGGWVAPKIYYLGYAGVLRYRGVRIGGMSGIYKGKDYTKGHFEHPPYDEDTKRSAYHIRNIDVYRLKQIKSHIDIFLSHDWPRGIHKYGNAAMLVKKKQYFKEEVEKGILGNPVAAELLYLLQPSYWFSAHLHVKFPALVQHSVEDENKLTKFLALDKCLPKRQFLQVLDVPHDPNNNKTVLELDPEWLVILKLTNHLLDLTRNKTFPGPMPGGRSSFTPTEEDIRQVKEEFGGDLSIPDHFERTVKVFDPNLSKQENKMGPPGTEVNPQTTLICSMLDLTDPNAVFLGKDSTYKLSDDREESQDADQDDNKPDDVDDDEEEEGESEPSFIFSESDRSQSFLSDSFVSAGNDSFLSAGNDSFLSAANESFKSLDEEIDENKAGRQVGKETDNEFKINSGVHKLNKEGRRLSLADKLAKCDEINKSNSASSTSEDDDLEFQAIMMAQRAGKGGESKSSSDELEVLGSKTSSCSDASLDCKNLDISDEDPELLEMMKAQKASKHKANKQVLELSMESDDLECKDIVKTQTDIPKIESASLRDIQKDFLNIRPTYQSSPFVSNEDRLAENVEEKVDVSPSSTLGVKRVETTKTNESPVTKRFRRRNQDMYSDNSTGDED